jgi:hypothetical protein
MFQLTPWLQAGAWLVAMKWKPFQRLSFESSGKLLKRVSRTVVLITGLKPRR